MKDTKMLRWPRQVMIRQDHEEHDVMDCDSHSALFFEDAAHPDIFMGVVSTKPRRP
jgi:hypothetical protein